MSFILNSKQSHFKVLPKIGHSSAETKPGTPVFGSGKTWDIPQWFYRVSMQHWCAFPPLSCKQFIKFHILLPSLIFQSLAFLPPWLLSATIILALSSQTYPPLSSQTTVHFDPYPGQSISVLFHVQITFFGSGMSHMKWDISPWEQFMCKPFSHSYSATFTKCTDFLFFPFAKLESVAKQISRSFRKVLGGIYRTKGGKIH